MADKYNTLLTQLAGRLEVIDKENRQTHTLVEAGRASRRSIDKARRPARTGTPPYLYARHQFFETFLMMFAMLGWYFPARAFIYRISENNRQLATNDLKHRYVKMCGKSPKEADRVGNDIQG